MTQNTRLVHIYTKTYNLLFYTGLLPPTNIIEKTTIREVCNTYRYTNTRGTHETREDENGETRRTWNKATKWQQSSNSTSRLTITVFPVEIRTENDTVRRTTWTTNTRKEETSCNGQWTKQSGFSSPLSYWEPAVDNQSINFDSRLTYALYETWKRHKGECRHGTNDMVTCFRLPLENFWALEKLCHKTLRIRY